MNEIVEIERLIDASEHLGYGMSSQLTNALSFAFSEKNNQTHHGLQIQNAGNMPEKAYNLIQKFMEKCEALHGPENYDKQAISSDLTRACAEIPVETPEMAEKLINMTSKLSEMRSDGVLAKFQLDTFSKQGRFLGEKKVAEAYLNATSKAFNKLDTPYDSCVSALSKYKSIVTDHPEMTAQVLDTVSMLQDRFADNPYYKECTNDILKAIADNQRIDINTRTSCKNKLSFGIQQTHSNEKIESQSPQKISVKDRAKDFKKTAKSYTGGKGLFTQLKDKMETFVKENPKLLTVGGAAAMFAGISSMNPQLAAAGAIVMSAGVKAWKAKLKDLRGLGRTNNSSKTQSSKSLTLDYAVHTNLTSQKGR